MSQILLFTQNVLNEKYFEKCLRKLGHEVFTTKDMIDLCLLERESKGFITTFQYVILSETVCNIEAKELAIRLSKYQIPIVRKSDEKLDKSSLHEWKEVNISEWIGNCPNIEVLREKFAIEKASYETQLSIIQETKERISVYNLNLSNNQLKLFLILYEAKSKLVSREEACLKMWNKSISNSGKSQLSMLVNQLKSKLMFKNIKGPIIETCWGRGYKLDAAVFLQIIV
ncbi:helix-turn-helix domain-containing protein [Enterococcus faecalis]|uniref:helix-turn-helix domain-containing protein n=1 Tax=Enterococcus faecalis TaxID=1351 RepID=UPI002FBDE4AD